MCKTRWTLALLVGLVAACGAPSTAIAPSRAPMANGAGLNIQSITAIAAGILSPMELRSLVARPFTLVRSESGEQRVRQVLVGVDGVEAVRVESALDGSLRLIAKSGVAVDGAGALGLAREGLEGREGEVEPRGVGRGRRRRRFLNKNPLKSRGFFILSL